MAKRNRNNNNNNNTAATLTTNKVDITTAEAVTYKQQQMQAVEENLNIQKDDVINAADKVNLANQCYHNYQACEVGTCSSTVSKYAVFYSNRWFFCAYKRDENRVTSMLPMSLLTPDEMTRFLNYKSRLENDQRIARLNTMTEHLPSEN